MNEESMKEYLSVELNKEDTVSDDEVSMLWYNAKMIILNKRYPFQDYPTDSDSGEYMLEDRYLNLCYRIAVELFAKEGAEGEITHTENGVTRQYASGAVSPHLLKEITPKGKVVS